MDVLTGHQQDEHKGIRANFRLHIIKNGKANAECNNCQMHFGISA